MLAASYAAGYGVPLDQTEAAHWFHLAAARGNAVGQYQLGRFYHAGTGVQQDHAEAARWYRLAAEQGVTDAHVQLGHLYAFGRRVPKDHTESVRWYRLAANQGHADAQQALGFAYAEGANGLEEAREHRDRVEAKLTRTQTLRATELARACLQSNYQTCNPYQARESSA